MLSPGRRDAGTPGRRDAGTPGRRDAGLSLSLRSPLTRSERGGSSKAAQAMFMAPAVISRLRRRSSAS